MTSMSFLNGTRALPALLFCAGVLVGALMLQSASAHYSNLSAQVTSTSCGNAICDNGETSATCSADCAPPENACREKADAYETAVNNNQTCSVDSDCMLFESSCPFITCGVAINKNGESAVAGAADALLKCKSDNGIRSPCASCVYLNVRCSAGRCVTSDGTRCGNGILEGTEQCDDGNTVNGDGCTYGCRVETTSPATCIDSDGGRNLEQRGEVSFQELEIRSVIDYCTTDTQLVEYTCGTGLNTQESIHECPYGCREGRCNPQPTTVSTCGDGICTADEARPILCPSCALGTPPERCQCQLKCPQDCPPPSINNCAEMDCIHGCENGRCLPAPASTCGNRIKEGSEQCDDGNLTNGDGCSAACRIEEVISFCGDGICTADESRTVLCPTCAPGMSPEQCRCQVKCPQDCPPPSINNCAEMDCIYGCENGRCIGPPVYCGDRRAGETYPADDNCNRCTCTEQGEVCTKMACVTENRCEPITCSNGATYPRCTEDGIVINYFVHPCRPQEDINSTCGNDICENDEQLRCPQDCPIRTDDLCMRMLCPDQHVCRNGQCVPVAQPIRLFTEPSANHFRDTTVSDDVGRAANILKEREIIGGYPDGTFGAEKFVNRAEAAKFLMTAVLTGELPDLSSETSFSDVASNQWFTNYVALAARFGVINGNPDNTFRPANTINTAEFLKMLTIAFNLESGQAFPYADVPADAWFSPYAGTAYAYRLFADRGEQLEPGRLLTRGEVALAIASILER